MLKDIRELGKDLQRNFSEINMWPEVSFNESDRRNLGQLENVDFIDEHSITLTSDHNHCIIPSQYILYAIFIKEFAIGLRNHLDLFDSFKSGKPKNDLVHEINSGTYDLDSLGLDSWSQRLAFKPITDSEYNFNAKAIINGQVDNYKIRGSSDFFTSVILKIINVPDSSSSILGKVIYSLTGHKEVYDYLEKRFLNKLPFIVKEKRANRFAFRVFSFLEHYDSLKSLESSILVNKDTNYKSIKTDNSGLTSLFRMSKSLLSKEELSMGGKPRFVESPLFIDANSQFHYLSTEWTAGTNSRLDIDSLKDIIANHYPEFEITRDEELFILHIANKSPLSKSQSKSHFKMRHFEDLLADSHLSYSKSTISRYVASLLAKPFIILTGLTGSGKTKLAQAFAQFLCANQEQYAIVPVGADWTNRDPLLGYPDSLNPSNYFMPETGVLQLMQRALADESLPFFLILDEMNLSHVERYFADFLSVMESDDKIRLHDNNEIADIDKTIPFPKNLLIIGTVNIDETTHMFSPKVLDRAHTIEFRINEDEMSSFFNANGSIKLEPLEGKGKEMAAAFLELKMRDKSLHGLTKEKVTTALLEFFNKLKPLGAEFGYRTGNEIQSFIASLELLDEESLEELGEESFNEKVNTYLDYAIVQKLLPKLHGSRKKLIKPLIALGRLCAQEISSDIEVEELFKVVALSGVQQNREKLTYPLSFEKIARMYVSAIENGYASFAEA